MIAPNILSVLSEGIMARIKTLVEITNQKWCGVTNVLTGTKRW